MIFAREHNKSHSCQAAAVKYREAQRKVEVRTSSARRRRQDKMAVLARKISAYFPPRHYTRRKGYWNPLASTAWRGMSSHQVRQRLAHRRRPQSRLLLLLRHLPKSPKPWHGKLCQASGLSYTLNTRQCIMSGCQAMRRLVVDTILEA
jgi:hypothetical protein